MNYFFSGFIVARVPFPLTQRFRGMLQQGVGLADLDVTYVSSLSWYFLNLFGLSGVLGLVLGESTLSAAAIMQSQQQMMMMGMDTPKVYVAEREALEGMHVEWALPKMEEAAVKTLQRKLANRVI